MIATTLALLTGAGLVYETSLLPATPEVGDLIGSSEHDLLGGGSRSPGRLRSLQRPEPPEEETYAVAAGGWVFFWLASPNGTSIRPHHADKFFEVAH